MNSCGSFIRSEALTEGVHAKGAKRISHKDAKTLRLRILLRGPRTRTRLGRRCLSLLFAIRAPSATRRRDALRRREVEYEIEFEFEFELELEGSPLFS